MSTLAALDVEKLQAARLAATLRFPYLATALHSLHVRPAPGLGTFAVDRHWRLYVDPLCVDTWSVAELAGVLLHEVWHVLRDHAGRGDRAGAQHSRRAWNLAADAEINDDLVQADVDLPGSPVLPCHLGMPEGLLVEEYFRAGTSGGDADCGSGADGHPRPHEVDDGPAVSASEAELVRTATAQTLAEAARTPGSVPGGWQRWAQERLRPQVDWRLLLRAAVRRGLVRTAGAVDHTWTRPSRRGQPHGVLLPGLRRPVPVVAVVLDTSASVDEGMLAQALAEVDGTLQAAGVREQGVTVLCCDSAVGPAQRVRAAARVDLRGGGGTDLRVGIGSALALRPRPDVVVVLTDGHTPWPASAPAGCRVVVALLAECPVPPPAWTTVVQARA